MTKHKKVKIGGHWYKIEFKRHLSQNHGAAGTSCANDLKIRIDSNREKSQRDEIFWHEVFEQLSEMYELNLPHPAITLLGSAFQQVLTDNHKIVKEFS